MVATMIAAAERPLRGCAGSLQSSVSTATCRSAGGGGTGRLRNAAGGSLGDTALIQLRYTSAANGCNRCDPHAHLLPHAPPALLTTDRSPACARHNLATL